MSGFLRYRRGVYLDAPKGFKDPIRIEERLRLLETTDTVQPLREWSADLVARRKAVVPHFDPAEGGVEARVLLVHEAPGPMAIVGNKRPGSGFISVDNNDRSAENVWRTRDETGLHHGVLGWNIVPWYLGPASVKPTTAELREGGNELLGLLALLPEVRVVVVSGLYAQNGWRRHVAPRASKRLTVIETWHPSPQSMLQLGKRDGLRRAYERAAALIQ